MENSNQVKRSELWTKIHEVLAKLPLKEVEGDSLDASSASTEIEQIVESNSENHKEKAEELQWISVKDKLPNELDTILIYDAVSDLSVSIGHRDKKGFNDWVEDEYTNITHWMPIPKPPSK